MNLKRIFSIFILKILNREASSPANRPEETIKCLEIKEGDSIADIGSGGGYYSFLFCRKVGKQGKVYAVDVNQTNLQFVEEQAQSQGIKNLIPVLASDKEMALPQKNIDLVFLRNVFHHLPAPLEYLKNLKPFLKPDGKIAIIEHRKTKGFTFVALFKHYTPEETIMNTLQQAGYSLMHRIELLPDYSFLIFKESGN